MHAPKQVPYVQEVASVALTGIGKLLTITVPNTGNSAFFAARKNSRLDCKGSLCSSPFTSFLLDIKLSFICIGTPDYADLVLRIRHKIKSVESDCRRSTTRGSRIAFPIKRQR